MLLLPIEWVDEESCEGAAVCDADVATAAGVRGTSVWVSAASCASLSAGCRSGSGMTTDLPSSPSTPLSKSCPGKSSLYPISPGLDGKGPACGLKSLVGAVDTGTDEADAVDAIELRVQKDGLKERIKEKKQSKEGLHLAKCRQPAQKQYNQTGQQNEEQGEEMIKSRNHAKIAIGARACHSC